MTGKASGVSRMKILTRGFKKTIALVVIAAFAFQMNIFLHPQVEVEIVKQFQRAKAWYLNGQYDDARMRIERVIDIINEKNIDRKDILGMCYLLLGAIAEKQNKPFPAEENYRKARGVYGITLVDGVDLEGLSFYRIIVKGELPSQDGRIEKEGQKKKKKFPWLLAVGGAIVVGVLVYFLFLKPKKKYQLTVTSGEGVLGTPQSNTYRYKKGTIVEYNYTRAPGYSDPVVTLDGNVVPNSGTVKMDKDHILAAVSSLNVVTLVPDRGEVEIPEGKSISFRVKLSAQPRVNVNVTASRFNGDEDIRVIDDWLPLTFTTSNWDTYQSIFLQADEDTDVQDDMATIRLSAIDAGIDDKYITVREKDNGNPTISITEPKAEAVLKGEVVITANAWAAEKLINRVDFCIDGEKVGFDIAAPYSYTWNTIRVQDGEHKIKAIAYDSEYHKGEHEIIVRVDNWHTFTVTKGDGVEGSPVAGSTIYADNEIVSYNYTLQAGFQNLSVLLDGIEVPASGNIFMDRDHALSALANPALYSLSVEWEPGVSGTPESGIKQFAVGETIFYEYALQEGYFDLVVKLDGNPVANSGTVTMNKNHRLEVEAKVGFETDTDEVLICEGQTKQFGVKLTASPENPVTVVIRLIKGDSDISVDSGGNLIFTPSDWNVFQYVTLRAAGDTDTVDGKADLTIEAAGLSSLDIAAKEHDTAGDAPPEISISGISDGQVIYGIVVIGATIIDDDGIIQMVELYIDSVLVETSTNKIYKYDWNTAGVTLGEHKIKIIAYDMCGQPGEKEITVSVVGSPLTIENKKLK